MPDALLLCQLLRLPWEEQSLPALSPSQWGAVVQVATAHGLAPLLYYRLAKAPPIAIPEGTVQTLRELSLGTSLANLKAYQELEEVASVLWGAGVRVMLLKGIQLARFAYPSEALRPMEDIDLLVLPPEYERACQVLGDSGYRFFENRRWGETDNDGLRHTGVRGRTALTIELHRTFGLSARSTGAWVEEVFARGSPLPLGSGQVVLMCPEDLLLHVAMHASCQHAFGMGMLGLWDLWAILRRYEPGLDWDSVSRRARQWGADRGLWLTLSLAHQILGLEIPGPVMEALHPGEGAGAFLTVATRRILAGKMGSSPAFATLSQVAAQRSFGGMARAAWRRAFPPPDQLAKMHSIRHPLLLVPAYLTRMAVLARRYLPVAWRLLLGEPRTRLEASSTRDELVLRDWLQRRG